MIRAESAIDVPLGADEAFAFVDDVANNPRYMSQCVSLETTSPPPKGVGTTLRYRFKQGRGDAGEMTGVVTAHEPPRALVMTFADPMFDVVVAYDVAPTATGSRVVHVVEITPKRFLAKLMTPLIRLGVRKQMPRDMAKLKELLSAAR